jgi:hypothetical protein
VRCHHAHHDVGNSSDCPKGLAEDRFVFVHKEVDNPPMLQTQIQEVKAELVRWVFLVMLGNVALSAGATALLNALQHGH